MRSAVFGPYEYISLFIALGGLYWGVVWPFFLRQYFTTELKGRAPTTAHWLAWLSLAVGFLVIYAALVNPVRSGAIDRLWLSSVATGIFLIVCVDMAVLAIRVNRSRNRPAGADEPR